MTTHGRSLRTIRVTPLRPACACERGNAIRHAKHTPVGHEPQNSPHGGGTVTYPIDMTAPRPPVPDPAPWTSWRAIGMLSVQRSPRVVPKAHSSPMPRTFDKCSLFVHGTLSPIFGTVICDPLCHHLRMGRAQFTARVRPYSSDGAIRSDWLRRKC